MAALRLKMDELEIQANDTRVHVVSTNAGPRFEVEKYLVNGNTILPSAAIGQAITNIDGAFGTNVGFDGIETVVTELGKAYHERGYVTVAVNVPQQKLTNATVKLQVLEGRLADIKVAGNRYFSSNNVMRCVAQSAHEHGAQRPDLQRRTEPGQRESGPANLSRHRPRSRTGHQ